jgi:hypothetical protein
MLRVRSALHFASVFTLLVMPGTTRAQWRGELEVSGARLRQEDRPTTGALTFGSTIAREGPRTSLELIGLGTIGDGDQRTAQGIASASYLGAARGRWRWSLGVDGSVFAEPAETASLGGYAKARQQILFSRGGLWTGLSIGGINDRGDVFSVRSGDAGVWQMLGPFQGALSATVIDTRSAYYAPDPASGSLVLISEPVTYTDAAMTARWEFPLGDARPLTSISLHGGMRVISRGAGDEPQTKTFASADLEVGIAPRVSLAASLGRQLSDLARGTPASRYATFGLRVAMQPTRRARRATDRSNGAEPRLGVESDVSGTRLFITASPARSIEVSGTFTGWEPVALEQRDGRWLLPRTIASGTHRVLMRIDGGPWITPPNLTAIDDGEGSRVALLIVP